LGGEGPDKRTIPASWEERQTKLEDIITDKVSEILSECDNEFYECSDNLTELNYQFILTRGKNKSNKDVTIDKA